MHVGRVGQAVEIVGRDGEILSELSGAWIAGGAIQFGPRILSVEGPAERVLPASASYH
jgi:hypothetical protein